MRACACWQTLRMAMRHDHRLRDGFRTRHSRALALGITSVCRRYSSESFHQHARARMFMTYPFCCRGGMYVSFLYVNLDLRLVIMLPAYACSMFASLPRTPYAVPAPAMCRAPGLPISVGGAGAHTAPASPTLTLAVGVVCAAQNRLPKA